ncbi:ABC transporter ATP-binding protein [Bhargavaea ullalensis]|uniref:ABC-2 type transport system ATP-binding protein n=1 Tax=Bhargavaea ullalensis TaxID=1265685 RepID=A0ABV2G811_9BACL
MQNITVKGLKKSYGNKEVLKGLDFSAEQGEVIAVIGKNGAGKSTFLESLMMIRDFDEGRIELFGKDIRKLNAKAVRELKRDMSTVLQPTNFYKNLKVKELLSLFNAYYGKDADLEGTIRRFELGEHLKSPFDKLSGGWKQRVALAIAFMTSPRLVILDEPTTGLDPYMRDVLWKNIIRHNREHKGTILLSTHYMDEVERYCDKVLLIHEGRARVFDKPANILAASGHASINDYYLAQIGETEAVPC